MAHTEPSHTFHYGLAGASFRCDTCTHMRATWVSKSGLRTMKGSGDPNVPAQHIQMLIFKKARTSLERCRWGSFSALPRQKRIQITSVLKTITLSNQSDTCGDVAQPVAALTRHVKDASLFLAAWLRWSFFHNQRDLGSSCPVMSYELIMFQYSHKLSQWYWYFT